MKTLTKILFNLTLAGLLAAGLSGCAAATTPAATTPPAVVKDPVSLNFEDGANPFTVGWIASAVIADTGTNKTKVLSLTADGNYDSAKYTLAAPIDLATKRTLKIDLNTPATDGAVVAVIDAAGNGWAFWVPGTGTWATATLNLAATGFTDNATPTPNTGWAWGKAGAADLTKITTLVVTGNEHKETILVDNISLK